jgi:hypothetical protein
MLIGDALWYKLFDESCVDATSFELSKHIGPATKPMLSIPSSTSIQINPRKRKIHSTSPRQGRDINYSLAWSFLTNPSKVEFATELAALMEKIGMSEAEELELCEPEEVLDIASKLKKIPQRGFLKAMGRVDKI